MQTHVIPTPEPYPLTGNVGTTGQRISLEVPSGWMLRMEPPNLTGHPQASSHMRNAPGESGNHFEASSYLHQDPCTERQLYYRPDTYCGQQMYDTGAPPSFEDATG